MISRFLQRVIGELINAKDGSISHTRLASVTGHATSFSLFVAWNINDMVRGNAPNTELWLIYLSITVMHHAYDKTLMMVKGKKENDSNNP